MKKKITLTINEEIIKQIKLLAIEKDTSVSSLVELKVKELLKENGKNIRED